MNKKISSGEVMCIAIYLVAVSFFAIINTTTLKISGNATLLAFILGTLLGIIPVFMIMYISKKIDTDFYTFLKTKFKFLGIPLIIILILLSAYLIFIFSFIFLDFVIGQFLTRTSYYFISISLFIFVYYGVKQGLEVISRTIFILFIFSFVILMFFFITLIPYTELINIKPYIDTSKINILKSTFITVSLNSFPLVLLLNVKDKVTDQKNFPRKILIGFLISSIIMFLFLLFTLLIYGIEYSSILTYPSYSLFKDVQIFGFIERIENIVSIIFFAGFYAGFIYYVHFISDNINNIFKVKSKKKKNIIIFIISLGISTLSTYLFKNYETSNLINYTYYITILFFIVLLIIFIRCLFIRKKSKPTLS